MSTPTQPPSTTSRFAEPPEFDVVGYVNPEPLFSITAAAPNQARAPKGVPIGGQWIDTAKAVLNQMGQWLNPGNPNDPGPGDGLVETPSEMARPSLSEKEIKNLRQSSVSGQHIDENGEWTPERKAWQEEQVNLFLDGVESQPEGEAQAWFNGGGPGSGKSSFTNGTIDEGYPDTRGVNDLTGEMDFAGVPAPGAVLIDPDAIKMQFPEVKAMRQSQVESGDMASRWGGNGGGNWASESHEESSYMAKMIFAEAQRRNVNVVYDGTGTKIVGKAQEALNNGYKSVHANYMYVEPDQALESAIERAGRIGRNVPPGLQASQYVDMPKAFETGADSGIFSTFNLYDRNGVVKGQDIPKIFEILPDGSRKILDQAAYDRFLSSGGRVPDVSHLG